MIKTLIVGNVVELNSGGPRMTVVRVFEDTDMVDCVWFDKDSKLQQAQFKIDSLKTHPL